ncbi:hypothetical protein DFS34DRAFT_612440 [Phlyctochytrium arcticum]|nr:hypothetical protein DFS34DRAFT_612440 [Phlyctochytrium arcticum]
MSSVGLLTSLKRRFYNYPTIFVSYILALSCPVMMLTVYPWRRENGYRPPVDAPRTFPIPQRARVIPSGYED